MKTAIIPGFFNSGGIYPSSGDIRGYISFIRGYQGVYIIHQGISGVYIIHQGISRGIYHSSGDIRGYISFIRGYQGVYIIHQWISGGIYDSSGDIRGYISIIRRYQGVYIIHQGISGGIKHSSGDIRGCISLKWGDFLFYTVVGPKLLITAYRREFSYTQPTLKYVQYCHEGLYNIRSRVNMDIITQADQCF